MLTLFILLDIPNKPVRDIVDYITATGAIATCGAFIYLFVQQRINKKQYHEQSNKNSLQQFESSLFNLLGLHNQIIGNLKYQRVAGLPIETGRDVFNEAKLKLDQICKMIRDDNSKAVDLGLKELYVSHYYKEFEHIFNHYFRNLYHIFKYIDDTTLIEEDTKEHYTSIARAQLSQNELLVIMFNLMIQDYGYPKFTLLCKKYDLLKNFRHNGDLIAPFYNYYKSLEQKVTKSDKSGVSITIVD